jgi:DNA-binding response OmpR family regulator
MQQLSGYIAIVDDDAPIREALARLLRVQGMNSRSYPSAHVFLEDLASGMPDCLIVDVNMPGMTGIELQRELLSRDLRSPTIVISANDDNNIAASAVSLGAAAFFVKPVRRGALMAAINSVKKRHGMHTRNGCSSVALEWLDACRSGQLDALLDLHEERATLTCDCERVNLDGRNAIATYWKSKLESRAASAFTLDDMFLAGDEIQVHCHGCKGEPVSVHLRFSPSGKVFHTRFSPLPRSA